MAVAERLRRFAGAPQRPYEDFADRCLARNEPAIFDRSLVDGWRAFEWVRSDGELDLDALDREFGAAEVSVADCATEEHDRRTMPLSEVLAAWRTDRPSALYVKDFHAQLFARQPFYDTPGVFADDWMQAFALARTESDYRFVYVGDRGTWTGLHVRLLGAECGAVRRAPLLDALEILAFLPRC